MLSGEGPNTPVKVQSSSLCIYQRSCVGTGYSRRSLVRRKERTSPEIQWYGNESTYDHVRLESSSGKMMRAGGVFLTPFSRVI